MHTIQLCLLKAQRIKAPLIFICRESAENADKHQGLEGIDLEKSTGLNRFQRVGLASQHWPPTAVEAKLKQVRYKTINKDFLEIPPQPPTPVISEKLLRPLVICFAHTSKFYRGNLRHRKRSQIDALATVYYPGAEWLIKNIQFLILHH